MSCTEFETMVTDLADDRLMDAMTRRRLQVHAEECDSCAARLNAERLLNVRLDALASETENTTADPALKAELLSAFAKLHAPENRFVVHETPKTQNRYWLLAAAAAVIVALLSIAVLVRRTPVTTDLATHATPATSPSAVATPSSTPIISPEPAAQAPPTDVAVNRPRTQSLRRVRSTVVKGSNEIAAVTTEETTTEYLPLTYTSDQTALQAGIVVRVEIPRATLVAMGLPMNTDRGNTLVKADVVVGDDGVPRAIRLVQ